jgi:hypothetical protein
VLASPGLQAVTLQLASAEPQSSSSKWALDYIDVSYARGGGSGAHDTASFECSGSSSVDGLLAPGTMVRMPRFAAPAAYDIVLATSDVRGAGCNGTVGEREHLRAGTRP